MNSTYITTVVLIVFGAITVATAQGTITDTIPMDPNEIPVLPGDEVEVLKDFKARLAETKMIQILPELPIQSVSTIPYYYEVNTRGLSLDYLPPLIRPVALPREDERPSYNSMVQFAYGYPRLSQARADMYYDVTDKLGVGLQYDHLAAHNKDRQPRGFYRHDGRIYSSYRINNAVKATAEVNVAIDRHYLVSKLDGSDADKRDTRLYGMNIGFEHPHVAESTIDYNVSVGYQGMLIDFLDHEDTDSRFHTEAFVEKRLGAIGLSLGMSYNYVFFDEESTNPSDITLSYSGVGLSPKISYNTEIWNISAGLDVLWENADANFLPQIQVLYAIAGSKLHIGVFAKTDVKMNSLMNIQQYNPYFGRLNTILNEKTQQYGIRIAGNFDRYEYAIETGYKSSKDLLAYRENKGVLDLYPNIRWYGDQVDANTLFFDMNGSYKLSKDIKLRSNFSYQNFRDSLDQDVAGTFDMNWKVGAEIKLLDSKLTITPSLNMLMNIERGYEYDHNTVNDFSLDIDYRVHKNASVYIKSYNLLNNKNERWAGYQALGIGVAGGVSVRF